MWIVRLALRRPYTFVVASILILILGVVSILRTPTDIFPNIDIPIVSALWNYGGLTPEDMANRIVSGYERNLTTTVNNIEHIESQTLTGIADRKNLFPTGHKHCSGHRRGSRLHRTGPTADASGNDSAACNHL